MSRLRYFFRYYETVRHLRLEQLFFFLVKPFRKKIALYFSSKNIPVPEPAKLKLQPFLNSENYFHENKFTLLNREKIFEEGNIKWNFLEYGLLWNYDLNYFDFLLQENLKPDTGLNLIHDFIAHADKHSASYDPYPTSLRGINWIKFLVKNNIDDSKVNDSLFRQYVKLSY